MPELKVNDDVVMTGSPMNLGEELAFVFNAYIAAIVDCLNKSYA